METLVFEAEYKNPVEPVTLSICFDSGIGCVRYDRGIMSAGYVNTSTAPFIVNNIRYQTDRAWWDWAGVGLYYNDEEGTERAINIDYRYKMSPTQIYAYNRVVIKMYHTASKLTYKHTISYSMTMDTFDQVLRQLCVTLPDDVYYIIADMIRGDGIIRADCGESIDRWKFPKLETIEGQAAKKTTWRD